MHSDNSTPSNENQPSVDELIAQKDLDALAAFDDFDYAAIRKDRAKSIGISVTLLDKIRKTHKRKLKEQAKEERKAKPLTGPNGKHVISVEGGSLSNNATAAERILLRENVQVYQRSSKLLRPVTEEAPASDNRKTKSAALLQVTETHMSGVAQVP